MVQLIEQDDFEEVIPKAGVPSKQIWFDTPMIGNYIEKMTISFEWQDQGWGYQKGRIWLQTFRGTKMIHETSNTLYGLAPHKWGNVKVTLSRDDLVISTFRPGDYFRFMRDIGWGGGHSLSVRNFTALLELQYNL